VNGVVLIGLGRKGHQRTKQGPDRIRIYNYRKGVLRMLLIWSGSMGRAISVGLERFFPKARVPLS